jgi:hypothetical protein
MAAAVMSNTRVCAAAHKTSDDPKNDLRLLLVDDVKSLAEPREVDSDSFLFRRFRLGCGMF